MDEDKTRIIRRPGQPGPGDHLDEDEPTRMIARDDDVFPEDLDQTRKISSDDLTDFASPADVEDDPAVVLPQSMSGGSTLDIEDDEKTVIYRPNRGQPVIQDDAVTGPVNAVDNSESGVESQDPVVGWLVVVEGPGRGYAFELGYGVNRVGRGSDQRISINFGDKEISREDHLAITYDHKGRKFYAQNGGSSQLAYFGDTPLLQPVEISQGDTLTIGQTKLAFIPFCNASFDWKSG